MDNTQEIYQQLGHIYDIHKLISQILYKKLSPFPLLKLKQSLNLFFQENKQAKILLNELLRIGLNIQDKEHVAMIRDQLNVMLKDEIIDKNMGYIKD
ncbi:MAG: hypothetical protein GXP45_00530 [bacterium]|nr:hypothetical protein [bacterium]